MRKLDKYKMNYQVGGQSNSVIAEDKEYVKTREGKILKIKNAPTHNDKVIKTPQGNQRAEKGGILLNGVDSVLSATHDNRARKDKLYTYKDEEIKISPSDVKIFNKAFDLNVSSNKSISPAYLLDKLFAARNSKINKFKNLSKEQRFSDARINSLKANRVLLAQIPKDKELYDAVFEFTEGNKSENQEEPTAQLGGDTDHYEDYAQYGVRNFSVPESTSNYKYNYKKLKPKDLDVNKLYNSGELDSRGAQNYINTILNNKYTNDKELLTIKDSKYNQRNNLKVPKSLIVDIARAAKVSGVDPMKALAIPLQESDLGAGADNQFALRGFNPNKLYSDWYGEINDQTTDKRAKEIVGNSLKYPLAGQMQTIKDKTSRFGDRGYNYSDPSYPDKIAKQEEIINFPENRLIKQTLDSAYNATPKDYFNYKPSFQRGGKLSKYYK